MAQWITHSPQETEQLGERVAALLSGGEVLAFSGGMGMGKTVFTRGLARGLGASSAVSSPTFTIVREYAGRVPIYHFDMYRITCWDDLYSCGFFDYLDGDGVLVVEWSENVEDALPAETIRIAVSRGEAENDRVFEISGLPGLDSQTKEESAQ